VFSVKKRIDSPRRRLSPALCATTVVGSPARKIEGEEEERVDPKREIQSMSVSLAMDVDQAHHWPSASGPTAQGSQIFGAPKF
jgi:hypothetical protein